MTEPAPTTPLPHAGVYVPPPFIFAAAFLVGWLIERYVGRLRLFGTDSAPVWLQLLGTVMLAAGLGLMFWGLLTFRAHKTAIIPMQPATTVVESGPYRFTRNPMYSGLTLVYLGLAGLLNMGWPMIVLPLGLLVLHHYVIVREERYLASAFGEQYESYRRRVGRWL